MAGLLQAALASGGKCVVETLKMTSVHACTHLSGNAPSLYLTKCLKKRLTTPRFFVVVVLIFQGFFFSFRL